MISPNTDIFLIKCPLELSQNNQLDFASAEQQINYFMSLSKRELVKCTYQRKDGVLRANIPFEEAMEYNYCVYRNINHGNKWFFAFIEDLVYSADSVTFIKLKTDVYQTYLFDFSFKPSFVEREHVNDDTIGLHTVPEALETGDYVLNGDVVKENVLGITTGGIGYFITFAMSDISPLGWTGTSTPTVFGGLYGGLIYIAVKNATEADQVIDKYIQDGKIDAIQSVFVVPEWLFGTPVTGGSQFFPFTFYVPQSVMALVAKDDKTVSRPTTINGYTPKNNKLFVYPYSYIFATNNNGNDIEYRYEDFTGTPTFRTAGVISEGCSIKTRPINYKNSSADTDIYGFNAGKLPICSWNESGYHIWLAQNELNVQASTISGLLGSGIGLGAAIATGSGQGIASSVLNIADTVKDNLIEHYYAERIPNQARGNLNSGNYNFTGGKFIEFRKMSIKAEYARIIDDYFSMFGYQVNRVKLPNLSGRRNWNFVKTVNCYIFGDFPQKDLEELKLIFNSGLTIWHNPTNFCDYSQNNDII